MPDSLIVAFVEGAKLKTALATSRVDEKPVTTTVTTPGVVVKDTFEMNGGVALVVKVWTAAEGTDVGAVIAAVRVVVPATVPVLSFTLEAPEKLACVDPAGIVKLTVAPPVANWIA